MNEFAWINGRIALPDGSIVGDRILVASNGQITNICERAGLPAGCETINLNGNLLAAGFIDTQVNGGGGVLFNDAPTLETIRRMAQVHASFGTTAFLPTLISDDLETISQGYRAVNEAIRLGVPGVIGIHVEGPFLNVDRKGIHDSEKIRQMDDGGMSAVIEGRPKLVAMTVAPECMSSAQLNMLTEAGVKLFAGHSDATWSEMQSAFADGIVGVTHLFNAMSQLKGREPGLVGAALGNPECWCCIIVDGVHVHPETLRLAIQAKGGLDHFVLVTDAMPTVGHQDKTFLLNGDRISVRDGVCQNPDGTLAGSDLDMGRAVANATKLLGISLTEAIRLASANPARMLGLESKTGSLQVGLAADLVELSDDGLVMRTWIKGQPVWDRADSMTNQ
ncbi:MAG: N-acetylglucosamine-6-phosphate deacetylase [Sphingomonadales bacterium 35-56-22]|nr:MAG: N-acetylglucosamine-6-phosphate deacetylase [Sphingomonadales bacterium 35-56-22]OYY96492.1 MAG: N-acetylglucosamine-6-phosphate deacetylase [Sphingomonadales bacterium 28-56-43]OYZ59363.1 MAG: N-acetylglucosamine-6-phosphate deacetylase [Sphingomonadales bacterium 24-56-14]